MFVKSIPAGVSFSFEFQIRSMHFSSFAFIYSWWQINFLESLWIYTYTIVKNRFRITDIEYDSWLFTSYKRAQLHWSQNKNSSTNHYSYLLFFSFYRNVLLSILNAKMMINFFFFLFLASLDKHNYNSKRKSYSTEKKKKKSNSLRSCK